MNRMLDKICGAIGRTAIGYDKDGESILVPVNAILPLARAALLAMRNVDREVLQVGAYAYDDERAIAPVWSAMIDAILKEGGE